MHGGVGPPQQGGVGPSQQGGVGPSEDVEDSGLDGDDGSDDEKGAIYIGTYASRFHIGIQQYH